MASELAEGLASIVPELPERTKATLEYLLTRDLAEEHVESPRPAVRLGLLVTLIEESQGEMPSVRSYDAFNRSTKAEWPSGAQIARDYGGWIHAVQTATSLLTGGRRKNRVRKYPSQKFSREEVQLSLVLFWQQVGSWPTSDNEYATWAKLARSIQLRWGTPKPRIAPLKQVQRRFGSVERAVAASQHLIA